MNRWTSADPLAVHGLGADPNLYAYVHGSPLKNVDPLGLADGEQAQAEATAQAAYEKAADDAFNDSKALENSIRERYEGSSRYENRSNKQLAADTAKAGIETCGENRIEDVASKAALLVPGLSVALRIDAAATAIKSLVAAPTPALKSALGAATSSQVTQLASDFKGLADATLLSDPEGMAAALGNLQAGNEQRGEQVAMAVASVVTAGGAAGASRAAGGVEAFEVGTYDALQARSVVGDALEAHHVGQAHAMEQIVPGYSRATGPAIALPRAEHALIPNLRGLVDLPPRQLLARDIKNLRNFTSAPNSSLRQLIDLNKKMYPGAFAK